MTSDRTLGELREELDRAWAIVDRQAKELDELRFVAPAAPAHVHDYDALRAALQARWDRIRPDEDPKMLDSDEATFYLRIGDVRAALATAPAAPARRHVHDYGAARIPCTRPECLPDDVLPCAVRIDGPLGAGVLIPGAVYRVAEVREHWEPTGVEGEPPHVSTVIRFDPAREKMGGVAE